MRWMLAQNVHVDHFPPAGLPGRWLFEDPLLLVLGLVVAGLLAVFVLRREGQQRWGSLVLLGTIGSALSVLFLAEGVTTDRERIDAGTRAFVQSIIDGDESTARELLSDGVVLAASGTSYEMDADQIAALATTVPRYARSANVRVVSASIDGARSGRTRLDVTVGADGTPVIMGWEFTWQKRQEGWRLIRAECVHVWNRSPQQAFRAWLPAIRR